MNHDWSVNNENSRLLIVTTAAWLETDISITRLRNYLINPETDKQSWPYWVHWSHKSYKKIFIGERFHLTLYTHPPSRDVQAIAHGWYAAAEELKSGQWKQANSKPKSVFRIWFNICASVLLFYFFIVAVFSAFCIYFQEVVHAEIAYGI